MSAGLSRRVVLLAPLLAATTRCASAQAPDQEWRGNSGGGPYGATLVAGDDAEWRTLWARLQQPVPFPLPYYAIAFSIALGSRSTGGFGIRIESIVAQDGVLVVNWVETTPSANTMQTQQVTDPYLVRLLPRTNLPVHIVKAG
jgi:hypothetical protein